MGQKTNSNLLRLGIKGNEWKSKYFTKTPEESSLIVFKDLEIKTYLKQYLIKHGLIFHDHKIHINNNFLYIYISYFSTLKSLFLINKKTVTDGLKLKKKKTSTYQKIKKKTTKETKILKKSNFLINSKNQKRNSLLKKYKMHLTHKKYINTVNLNNNNFTEQILETLSLFMGKNHNIFITFQTLNSNIESSLKTKVWKKKLLLLKRYKKSKFFKEAVNILFLTIKYKNSSQLIANFLARQLSIITKQSYFLIFFKRALNLFINSDASRITGIKIIINGRFNGRPRARNQILIVGSIPTQTLNTNIDYSQSVAFSSNGTFGIKIWITEKF